MIRDYEKLIPRHERSCFEEALMMESGYVLDFSDRTFDDFFYETVKIDPQSSPQLFNGRGTSKAKRLRSFIERAQPGMVAFLLRELWNYRASIPLHRNQVREQQLHDSYFQTVARFEGEDNTIDASAFEAFEANETLDELVAAIKRDLDAKRPQAGLDRLHTYCMKRYAALIRKHGGGDVGENDPLHSRVGRYVKLMTGQRNLTEMSERIIKSSISVFEAMNTIRNDKSLAHDNPDLIEQNEARFIFDRVTAFLRFTKSIDTRLFED